MRFFVSIFSDVNVRIIGRGSIVSMGIVTEGTVTLRGVRISGVSRRMMISIMIVRSSRPGCVNGNFISVREAVRFLVSRCVSSLKYIFFTP